jgi:hypothetical protein
MNNYLAALGSVLLFGLAPLLVSAQTAPVTDGPSTARKSTEIARTELQPVLDGVLDDAIWQEATVIEDMHQYQPVDQGPPSERSVFYIAYSERFLYVAARLYDSDPSGISARQLVQGQNLGFDDGIEFILDTFNNGRGGYQFQTNPNGIRREGVYDNPQNLNRDWKGIWQVESRIDEEGWTTEIAIPFNTLNFDPSMEEWGFTIARTIARKQEEIAWSSFNRAINPTTTGLITGIRDIRQGVGLDIIPSFATAANKNYVTGVSKTRVDPSLDMFYKITPNLTGALTFNTDFSATEVDNRQVNLSRFSLFFPEKRDFFLQDVDIFSFGGRGGGGNNFDNTTNGIPFYSRRVGLSRAGEPLDINAGVKLTGRVGAWNVGALAVQQGDSPGLEGQQVFVGRATANVLSESNVGMIFTHGDPTSVVDNSLAGVDFRYQNTRFSDRYTMRGNAFFQQSDTTGRSGDAKAYGVGMQMSTEGDGYGGNIAYDYFGEDYYPGLGFANRVGVETFRGVARRRQFFRDNPVLRLVNTFSRFEQARRLDTGEMQSETFFFRPFQINTHLGSQGGVGGARQREGLERDFEISPGVIIPRGVYTWWESNADIQLSNQRAFAPGVQLNWGDFYNGKRKRVNYSMEWRPDEHLFLSMSYDYQDISLPVGDFKVKLVSANVNYAFNSKWSWINLVQYENRSNSVGINSRLRWNPQAGEDLFIVVNYNFDADGVFTGLNRQQTEIALKYIKTFRY